MKKEILTFDPFDETGGKLPDFVSTPAKPFTPIAFQSNTIKELTDKIVYQYGLGLKTSSIMFEAPTGAGKTFMGAEVIKNLRDEIQNKKLVFVWISVSLGGLETQTALKFKQYGLDKIKLYGGPTEVELQPGDIFCAGWSALKAKVKDNGASAVKEVKDNPGTGEEADKPEKIAKFKKKSERGASFESMLNRLRTQEGYEFILFIDEAHHSAQTDMAQEIIEAISPKITIDISATPKPGIYQDTVVVDRETAKKSGIIKQAVVINEGFEKTEYVSELILLEKAKDQRELIAADFKKQGLKVNPLVLIQLKQDDAAEVEEQLKSIGVLKAEVGVWLSKDKRNLQHISDPDNKVSYLICNQAIATGWDCPRAHILVQMLKASEDFSEQVIGRTLRTVERKIYNKDTLDNAFIYTITNREKIEKIEEKVKTIHDVQYELKLNPLLNLNIDQVNENFKEIYSESFEALKAEDALSLYRTELRNQIKNQIQKKLPELTEAGAVEIEIRTGKIETQEVSLDKILEQTSSNKKIDLSMLEKFIVDKFGITAALYRVCEELAAYSKIPVSVKLIEIGKSQLKRLAAKYKDFKKTMYSLTPSYKVATSIPGIEVSKSLFTFEGKYYTNKLMSQPEEQMIMHLEDNPEVVWWFKNFDGGKKAFALVFKEKDEDKLHYPDFIIKTHSRLLFIETKIKTTTELEFDTNNLKYQAFCMRKDLNYSMVFVDTAKAKFFVKTGLDKKDIKELKI